MAPRNLINERSMKRSSSSSSSCSNKGAWTAEEDRKLAEFVKTHGAKKWKSIPVQAGLNRCGKSCRFRWLNYLRPNIKRGNISDQEEDLILRLHKLLGNRWSLIARRLPGRTDNEIKNYWNSHLSKKMEQNKYPCTVESSDQVLEQQNHQFDDHDRSLVEEPSQAVGVLEKESTNYLSGESEVNLETGFDIDEFFDFSTDRFQNLEWMTEFFGQDYNNLSNHKY